MSSDVLIVLLGFFTAVLWGVADFFAAKSAKSIGPILAAILVNFIGSLTFVVIYIIFLHPNGQLTWLGFGYSVASGLFIAGGAAALFIGLATGPVSVTSPLTGTYPLVTTVIALLIFHATLSIRDIAGILLTIIGIIAASGLFSTKKTERRIGKGPTFGLLAAFLWGIGFALLAQAFKALDWQTATLIEFTSVAVGLLVLAPLIKGNEEISVATVKRGISNRFILGSAVAQFVGVLTLNFGISLSTATGGAVVTALSACYPVLTVFLALKHFDEKIKIIPLLGAFVAIAGVVMLSLG